MSSRRSAHLILPHGDTGQRNHPVRELFNGLRYVARTAFSRLRFEGCARRHPMAKAALHRVDHDDLYGRNFHAWLPEQAAHARAGRTDALDLDNIAEELEGSARTDRQGEPGLPPDALPAACRFGVEPILRRRVIA